MNNAKGRTIYHIGNPHLATLTQLQHLNNLLPLPHLYQYPMRPRLKQIWSEFVRNKVYPP